MKAKEFFVMSNEELKSKLNALKEDLYALRFKHATRQLTNPLVIVEIKRDIARVNTIIRQRELNISFEPIVEVQTKPAKKSKKGGA